MTESKNPIRRLTALNQSVWLDYIDRHFLLGGALRSAIEDDGVTGITSNPAIFQKAFEREEYDEAIRRRAAAGLDSSEIYDAVVVEDIRTAADLLQDVYQRTQGRDGFVSLEVSPHFARDTEGTCREGERLWALVNRPNLMVKVPGTEEGVPAIRRLVARGINVNVTLLFSVERYAEVAEAYIAGLEERRSEGEDVASVASVASFFVSRIDTLVDGKLEAMGNSHAHALQGRSAVACAGAAYQKFRFYADSPRMKSLLRHGARLQKLLWASTGTKNAAYSKVKYVDSLIAPDTVTTLPLETFAAYRDKGDPKVRIGEAVAQASEVMSSLIELGIDYGQVAQQLEAEGIRKFVEPFDAALRAIETRSAVERKSARQ